MVRLQFLTGTRAGTSHSTRQFPCRIGRAAGNEVRIEEAGVWDQHLQIQFDEGRGFIATLQANASGTVNGNPIEATPLRNGDTIQIGGTKIQFWISETDQHSLRAREALTWIGLIALVGLQVALVIWVSR